MRAGGRRMSTPPARARGIALITVMLIVAVVATLATQLSVAQAVWLRQAQNLADMSQAEAVTEGALNFSLAILDLDKKLDTDNLTEDWALPQVAPVGGGAIAGRIVDAQSRFNLNNLLGAAREDIAIFDSLVQSLALDPTLKETLRDWIDSNSEVGPGGAEDDYYMNLPNGGYRAANQLLQSIDELRLIKGFAGTDAVQKLRPFVTALPKSDVSININTASAEIIAGLFTPPLNMSDAKQALADRDIDNGRKGRPFQNCDELKNKMPGRNFSANRCAVKTNYFEVEMVAKFGRLQRPTVALIQRGSGAAGTGTGTGTGTGASTGTGNTRAKILWQRQNIVKEFQLAQP